MSNQMHKGMTIISLGTITADSSEGGEVTLPPASRGVVTDVVDIGEGEDSVVVSLDAPDGGSVTVCVLGSQLADYFEVAA